MLSAPDQGNEAKTEKVSDGWLSLFQSILKIQDPQPFDLEITETAKTVVLRTHNAEIGSRLQEILQSPSTLYRSLGYEIKQESLLKQAPSVFEESYPPLPPLSNLLDIFQKIFDPSLRQRIGELPWDREIIEADNSVLYFCVQPRFEAVTRGQIELYRECLAEASFSQLRKAMTQESNQSVPLIAISSSEDDKSLGVLSKNADKILYVTKNQSGETIACFDVGLLCRCVTPPRI